ncbi:hypothetical protein CBL_04619 [Carabus blaptoides fortunei]
MDEDGGVESANSAWTVYFSRTIADKFVERSRQSWDVQGNSDRTIRGTIRRTQYKREHQNKIRDLRRRVGHMCEQHKRELVKQRDTPRILLLLRAVPPSRYSCGPSHRKLNTITLGGGCAKAITTNSCVVNNCTISSQDQTEWLSGWVRRSLCILALLEDKEKRVIMVALDVGERKTVDTQTLKYRYNHRHQDTRQGFVRM